MIRRRIYSVRRQDVAPFVDAPFVQDPSAYRSRMLLQSAASLPRPFPPEDVHYVPRFCCPVSPLRQRRASHSQEPPRHRHCADTATEDSASCSSYTESETDCTLSDCSRRRRVTDTTEEVSEDSSPAKYRRSRNRSVYKRHPEPETPVRHRSRIDTTIEEAVIEARAAQLTQKTISAIVDSLQSVLLNDQPIKDANEAELVIRPLVQLFTTLQSDRRRVLEEVMALRAQLAALQATGGGSNPTSENPKDRQDANAEIGSKPAPLTKATVVSTVEREVPAASTVEATPRETVNCEANSPRSSMWEAHRGSSGEEESGASSSRPHSAESGTSTSNAVAETIESVVESGADEACEAVQHHSGGESSTALALPWLEEDSCHHAPVCSEHSRRIVGPKPSKSESESDSVGGEQSATGQNKLEGTSSTDLSTTHSISVSPNRKATIQVEVRPSQAIAEVYSRMKARYNPWSSSSSSSGASDSEEAARRRSSPSATGFRLSSGSASASGARSGGSHAGSASSSGSASSNSPNDKPTLPSILDSDELSQESLQGHGSPTYDTRRQTPNFGSTPSVNSSPVERNSVGFDPHIILGARNRFNAFCATLGDAEERAKRERRLRVEIDKLRHQVVSLRGQMERDVNLLELPRKT